MDSGMYAAYTGLLARTQALDTAANNLANAGTNGFRAQKDYFRDVLAGQQAAGSQLGAAVNDFGVLGGNRPDLGQGALVETGNPLDLALDGQGFFALQTANGVNYTRDGAFERSQNGVLTTSRGEPVLDPQGKTIPVPSGEVRVGPDGSISVGGAVAGQVGVVDFPVGTQLTQQGANRFVVPAGTKPIAAAAAVRQGAVEGSNQDAVHGTMQLILVQRQAEMMQKALGVFDTGFDKAASEELPRV